MSIYPGQIDNIITLPTLPGTDSVSNAVNALREAIILIQQELGIEPSNPYTDIRARIDILESRFNNPLSPTLPDGYVNSPLFIANNFYDFTVSISSGLGVPTEHRIDGSFYIRQDGNIEEGLYVRRGGQWRAMLTDTWTAGGDLTGTYKEQTVGQRKAFLLMGS